MQEYRVTFRWGDFESDVFCTLDSLPRFIANVALMVKAGQDIIVLSITEVSND
jgi:hypothetical protein